MTGYLRYPHLHDDRIAFVAADDIWLAPVAGGMAHRLTCDRVPVRHPRFSPDGRHLAFVSVAPGHPEVMVTDLTSMHTRRLTWWGAKNTLLLGWAADGRVLAATHAGEANIRHLVPRAVGLDGSVERLGHGPAWGLAARTDGVLALVTPGSRPPAHWKRYRGGTAPRLWLHDPTGDGPDGGWRRLLAGDTAAVVDPMWVQRAEGDPPALVFVSDRAARFPDATDEQANLWRWDTPGQGEPVQLTFQGPDLGYVRDASTDGRRVTWHSRGALWVLDSLETAPRRLAISLPGAVPTRTPVSPTRNLDVVAVDHTADASLIGWHGTAFWLTHREGPARAIVADPSVRVREPVLLGRTGRVAFVTDADGDDRLEVHTVDPDRAAVPGPITIGSGALGRVLRLAADPAGERLAVISHDGTIRVVDLAGDGSPQGEAALHDLGSSAEGEARDPVFSPDGRYLLWSQPTGDEGTLHQLMIADLQSGTGPLPLTSGRFHDHCPAFTRCGRHVVFLSDRTFDPSYDTHEFGLSFAGATRPWLLPLSATEPAPFGPSVQGWRFASGRDRSTSPERDQADSASPTSSLADVPVSPQLDLPGAEERIVPFPVPSGSYRRLSAAADGVLWITVATDAGELGSRRAGTVGDPTPDRLDYWSFESRRVVTVAAKLDDYSVSGDGRRVVIRHAGALTVQHADKAPEEAETDGPGPDVVTVDLRRLRHDIDPRTQWRQMFDENARIMRDHFWRADMDGVDWAAVCDRWRPLIDTLGSHDDLVDLLWETVGELNSSHAYITAPDLEIGKARRLGLLGADLAPEADGWRIEAILPGESSDPDARSPLRAAGVAAAVGDLIVAVDGRPVDPSFGPNAGLVGAANLPVELTLRPAAGGADRRVVVIPVADEEVLRYQQWVASRREYVCAHSGGRLGYLHVPDMMAVGWAQLHRDLRLATRAEGVIADVRYNRGGHTSQLVLARLATRVVGWDRARHFDRPISYPSQSMRGPVVLVANENSGSDGDIVNAAAQAMNLGPVIGVRTWGGVLGIDGRFTLVDGTSVTQPRYAFWMQGKGWGVENHGVDPDIEVVHSPADFDAEADPQLDRAIAEALRLLELTPAAAPPSLPEPKVRAPERA